MEMRREAKEVEGGDRRRWRDKGARNDVECGEEGDPDGGRTGSWVVNIRERGKYVCCKDETRRVDGGWSSQLGIVEVYKGLRIEESGSCRRMRVLDDRMSRPGST